MKKFVLKTVAAAAGLSMSSFAFAGTITAPAAPTRYAVESLVSTTDLTLPAITYQMGVNRTTAQDFTIIFRPSAGSAFTAASCAAALAGFGQAGAGTVVVTQKRASTTECAYEVDVTADTDATKTLSFNGFVLDSHTLNTAGNQASITVGLFDLGETARIDNTQDLSVTVASSGNALTLTAAADTATQADVNDELGPLFGFVTNGVAPTNDADASARAAFVIGNNSGTTTWRLPDGATPWDFTVNGTSIAVTIPGNFQGLAANGFAASTGVGVAPVVTATAGGTSATFTLLPANINPGQTNTSVTTTFTSARTASLGTARAFGVSAVGDVVTGADVALAGSANWWTWGANATQLMTPYISTNPQYVTRISMLNTGTTAVGYTVQCYTEGTATATNGAGGTLRASGTTVVDAADLCTFSGAPRGAVVLTINAPSNTIKGAYNIVDRVYGSNGFLPLVRPYTAGAVSE